MMLRKSRIAKGNRRHPKTLKASFPTLEDFLEKRDYNGASTLLNFQSRDISDVDLLLWKAFCAFHNGDQAKAQEFYIELLTEDYDNVPKETILYLALTYYHMQMYDEAKESLEQAPNCPLKHRIMFHLANKMEEEEDEIAEHRQQLRDSLEDQLSKASMLYMQGSYQDATDAFKRLLIENRDNVALNVYVAMCYFKLGYFEVSQEALSVYEQMHSDSVFAKNLKACNNFRLYDGNAAVDELKSLDMDNLLLQNDLLRHNMVVFTDGRTALQTLPALVDVIPEAKLNLAIYHLRNGDCEEAEALLEDCEPVTPAELILKGVVKATMGQMQGNLKSIREAQSYFEAVGKSPTEADTIPGRHSMASALFLDQEFDDANVYLSSIKNFSADDDDFNWNYGISLSRCGDWVAGEETLLKVQNPSYKSDIHYCAWLARCQIRNGKADSAWGMYPSIDETNRVYFLKVIAEDCFRAQRFLVAARAFDCLQRLDDDIDYTLGLRSSCIGVFRFLVVEKFINDKISIKNKNSLSEAIEILQGHLNVDELKKILITFKQWMKKNIAK